MSEVKLDQSAFSIDSAGVQGQGSTQVIPANSYRKYLLIHVRGPNDVFLSFSGVVDTSIGVKMAAGATWELPRIPINPLHMITESGNSSVIIIEG